MPRLRMGMVGGGPGAFIGPLHRIAAELDGQIALVCGAFSSDANRSRSAGDSYGIAPDRAYPSFDAMIEAEAARADGMDFVAIVAPNHVHWPAAQAALSAGYAVISDKPATATLAEAHALNALITACRRPYALTYTYTGYPLVREARARIAAGEIGAVRKVVVEYVQGWLAAPIEHDGNKQAEWRADPARAGVGGCIADIGVHAFNLLEFASGLSVTRFCADLGAVVPGRRLDDDCNLLLRLSNGAPGVLMATQVATGARNGLRLRVHGTRASLDWAQEQPNRLMIDHADGRSEIIHAGSAQLGGDARAATRLPAGHPEGYLEAFANLYRDFALVLRGKPAPLLPGIEAGLRGAIFVDTAVAASRAGLGWTDLPN